MRIEAVQAMSEQTLIYKYSQGVQVCQYLCLAGPTMDG